MKRRLLTLAVLVATFVLVASSSFAQTVVSSLSIPAEYTEPFDFVSGQPIDADGDPDTVEYLLTVEQPGESYDGWKGAVRVAVLRHGRVCVSRWFHPAPLLSLTPMTAVLTQTNGRHHFRVSWLSNDGGTVHTVVEERAIDLPRCEPFPE